VRSHRRYCRQPENVRHVGAARPGPDDVLAEGLADAQPQMKDIDVLCRYR